MKMFLLLALILLSYNSHAHSFISKVSCAPNSYSAGMPKYIEVKQSENGYRLEYFNVTWNYENETLYQLPGQMKLTLNDATVSAYKKDSATAVLFINFEREINQNVYQSTFNLIEGVEPTTLAMACEVTWFN